MGADVWCLVGDFNTVCTPRERRGIGGEESFDAEVESYEFRGFIEDMHLVDLPTLARKFTWFRTNGPSMSQLDQIMVSEG